MKVTSDDYSLTTSSSAATNYSVVLSVGYADARFTSTLTQTLTVSLFHPCKATLLTTTQTISDINFGFGGWDGSTFTMAALLKSFTNFADSVSTAYDVANLCDIQYALSPAAEAIKYGVTLVSGTPNKISVLTVDKALIGITS
jgi:hypothetical protein